jgi:hypothetical protein
MNSRYSEEFIMELSKRLLEHADDTPERPLFSKLTHRKHAGEKLDYSDLDIQTLKELFIIELCSDNMVANLFGLEVKAVESMRNLYGLTDDIIPILHTKYITQQLAINIENELGDAAFNM